MQQAATLILWNAKASSSGKLKETQYKLWVNLPSWVSTYSPADEQWNETDKLRLGPFCTHHPWEQWAAVSASKMKLWEIQRQDNVPIFYSFIKEYEAVPFPHSQMQECTSKTLAILHTLCITCGCWQRNCFKIHGLPTPPTLALR